MKKITWLWAPMICAALLFSGCSEERTTSPRGTGLELTAEEQAHSIAIRATPINGNSNGSNGNDNGTNGNDNGSGGNCSDGSTQLETQMTGDEDNEARYRRWSDNCREFRVRVRELNPYTNYNVIVDGVTVGTLRTDDDGRGELRYENTGFPQNFPHPGVGSQVSVGPVWGTFWSDCSSNSNCNG